MKEKLIGHVWVDSGQIMLGDPCYLTDWGGNDFNDAKEGRFSSAKFTYDYHGACEASMSKDNAGMLNEGSAAVVTSGFGDGAYPVTITYSDEGSWGRRVKSVRIDFITDEEEEDS